MTTKCVSIEKCTASTEVAKIRLKRKDGACWIYVNDAEIIKIHLGIEKQDRTGNNIFIFVESPDGQYQIESVQAFLDKPVHSVRIPLVKRASPKWRS